MSNCPPQVIEIARVRAGLDEEFREAVTESVFIAHCNFGAHGEGEEQDERPGAERGTESGKEAEEIRIHIPATRDWDIQVR